MAYAFKDLDSGFAGRKTIKPVRAPGETPAPATIGLGAPPARVYAPPAANPYAPTGAPAGPTSVSGIDTQSPAGPNLAQQLRDQWGGNWNISGVDRADELARVLQSRGVTDLSNMKLGTDRQYADPNWSPNSWMNSEGWTPPDPNAPPETAPMLNNGKYLDFGNGIQIGNFGDQGKGDSQDYLHGGSGDNEFGWSSAGHGAVGYSAVPDASGKVRIVPNWNSSSDMGDIRTAAKLIGGVALGGMGLESLFGGASSAGGFAGFGPESLGGVGGADAGLTGGFGGFGEGVTAAGEAGLGGDAAAMAGPQLNSWSPSLEALDATAPMFSGPVTGEVAAGIAADPAVAGALGAAGGVGIGADAAAALGGVAGATGLGSLAVPLESVAAYENALPGATAGTTVGGTVIPGAAGGSLTSQIGSALSGVKSFIKENPQLAALGASGAATLLGGTPDKPALPGSGSGGTGGTSNDALIQRLTEQLYGKDGSMSKAFDYSSVPGLKTSAGDAAQINQQAMEAAYSAQTRMLDPQFQRERQGMEARLAEQGFIPGTPGYERAMSIFGEQQNKAYGAARDSSILQGYNIGQGQFGNQLSNAQLNNNASNSTLAQLLQERNQPLNELNSLKTGQQLAYENQLGQYNADVGSANSRNQALSQLALALGMYLG